MIKFIQTSIAFIFIALLLCSCFNWGPPISPDGTDDVDNDLIEGAEFDTTETEEDAADTVDVDGDGPCPEGQTLCSDTCVDLNSDTDNCGTCGNACLDGQICYNGECQAGCPPGLTDCPDGCVDVLQDVNNCGACSNVCPTPPNASPTCIAGICDYECLPGWSDINGLADDGCESECIITSPDEICNGLDDNCNGSVDEGFDCAMGRLTVCDTICGSRGSGPCTVECTAPPPEQCTPPVESCNGVDDDCDGKADNGFTCAVGEEVECTTICGTVGTGQCTSTCEIPTGSGCASPDIEYCNGLDDNCNSLVDETFPCVQGSATSCTTICGSVGTGTCTGECQLPAPTDCTPPAELCNGLDDDCDGGIDNGFDCAMGSSQACGNCGTQVCTTACTWDVCTGEGVCSPGTTQSCGICGEQTCQADCTWGTCSGGGVCAPGATQACGNCGTQTCQADCMWGACTGEGACAPGATQSCGVCGTQTCQADCSWGTCIEGGECTPGSTQTCGNCGTQTCSASCTWGSCTGEGVCTPGALQACGTCGTQTCQADCTWGTCVEGPADCTPGSTQTCGNCGTQTCTASCTWGACTGEGVCSPGATTSCTIGRCSGTQTCLADCTWDVCNTGPPPTNDLCSGAITIGEGTHSGTTCGAANDYTATCAGSARSPDVVYRLDLTNPSDVVIDTCGTSWDTALFMHSGGCPGTQIACNDDSICGLQSMISITLDVGTYYIFVDGYSSSNSGDFTLNISITPLIAENDTCLDALPLSFGGTTMGITMGANHDYTGSCGGSVGPDVVYTFTTVSTYDVFIGVHTTEFDPVIYLSSTCGSSNYCNDNAYSTVVGSALVLNALPAGTYYLIVDSTSATTGRFTIEAYGNYNDANGDVCGQPLLLADGATGNTALLSDDFSPSCRNNDSADAVHYFFVESTGTVTTSTCSGASWDTILMYRDDCDTGTDLSCNEDACGQQSQVSRSFSPGIYFLYVDGFRESGSYTLTVTGL